MWAGNSNSGQQSGSSGGGGTSAANRPKPNAVQCARLEEKEAEIDPAKTMLEDLGFGAAGALTVGCVVGAVGGTIVEPGGGTAAGCVGVAVGVLLEAAPPIAVTSMIHGLVNEFRSEAIDRQMEQLGCDG